MVSEVREGGVMTASERLWVLAMLQLYRYAFREKAWAVEHRGRQGIGIDMDSDSIRYQWWDRFERIAWNEMMRYLNPRLYRPNLCTACGLGHGDEFDCRPPSRPITGATLMRW